VGSFSGDLVWTNLFTSATRLGARLPCKKGVRAVDGAGVGVAVLHFTKTRALFTTMLRVNLDTSDTLCNTAATLLSASGPTRPLRNGAINGGKGGGFGGGRSWRGGWGFGVGSDVEDSTAESGFVAGSISTGVLDGPCTRHEGRVEGNFRLVAALVVPGYLFSECTLAATISASVPRSQGNIRTVVKNLLACIKNHVEFVECRAERNVGGSSILDRHSTGG
jgi:hypothetical protein